MDTSNEGSQNAPLSELASSFLNCRDVVLAQWTSRVTAEIPTAARIGEPILISMLPILYDNITEALSVGAPGAYATTDTNLAHAHGRERANMTDYAPHDLIHEFQIFREVLFSILKARGLQLSQRDGEVIGHSIEEATRESLSGFSEATKEVTEGFIASLSHDLRNPLHVANATAQLIQLKTPDPVIASMAKRISRKIGETDAMIQTLLDAALLKGRKKLILHIGPVDIMPLVEEVCADIPLLGPHVKVIGEQINGFWCRVSMKRVLENLLTNAQKYGDPSKPITVRVSREDHLMLLAVHNEGSAIPKHEMDRLFNAYERMENVSIRGWGLGLPYVQNVAESHGGTAVVDSAEGRGTTFTISVPVDARPYVDG